jgi:hypothetical protein
MIIYNVTVKTEKSIAKDYLQWLKEVHILDMMHTGLFSDYRICRLIDETGENDGETFVIQYHCDSVENYQSYIDEHSIEMRKKAQAKFADKFVAFRTVMELIN